LLVSFNQVNIKYKQVLCSPIEVIRTRLSLSESAKSSEGVKYKGIISCGKDILKNEGLKGYYKGIVPSLLVGTPYVGIQMSTYQIFKVFSYSNK
jgi:hypothetical protein